MIKKKIIKYGLLYKNRRILGYSSSPNPEDAEGVPIAYSLSRFEDNMWLAESAEHAECVRCNSTEWYNASLSTPINNFTPDTLKVVRIEQVLVIEEVDLKNSKVYGGSKAGKDK